MRVIWHYRDWVVHALNANLPYDRFTIEQLAGDMLPDRTNEQLLATAFNRNSMSNNEGGVDDAEFRLVSVRDRLETTVQIWMGLTIGCAKCHSHKFDPITQREYYQCLAFLDQTEDANRIDEEPKLRTPATPAERKEFDRLTAAIAACKAAKGAAENDASKLRRSLSS